MTPHQVRWRAFKAAVPYTLPILAGFAFLGLTYGIYMHQSGFNFIYPMLMSLTIFAGSAEFIVANLLLQAFNPVGVFFITLIINSRHLFYGLSMLDRYRHTGWKKPYLIFECVTNRFQSTIPQPFLMVSIVVGSCFL
jgi:4-azaleucine resistance transporter AzlC